MKQDRTSAIIFDCGGVLFLNDNMADIAAHVAPKYGASPEALTEVLTEQWYLTRTDPTHDNEFWSKSAQAVGITSEQLIEDFLSYPQFQSDIVQLARDLKRDYRVAMLSNQLASWLPRLLARHGVDDVFDPVIGSYTEGVAKPDPRAYQLVVDRLSVPASECIFIDDRESHLPPAQELGMTTILFTDPQQLRDELKSLGVL